MDPASQTPTQPTTPQTVLPTVPVTPSSPPKKSLFPHKKSMILLIISATFIGIMYLVVYNYVNSQLNNVTHNTIPQPTPSITISPTVTTSEGDQVMCTMDAKLCPDGSSVGRTGPNCEFSPCP